MATGAANNGLEKTQGAFGRSALAYVRAGWPEVLPIWKGTGRDKQPMVAGYHGRQGAWPDETTTRLWRGRYASANIALRLPRWVVGLDVDHYGDKFGGDVLTELEDEIGSLPATYVSTSREDGPSGIRLYAVPGDYVDSAWPAQVGEDIDMITWYERYVIVSPSMHKSGREYEWWLEGCPLDYLPEPGELPMLSEDWCEYLVSRGVSDSGRWDGAGYDGSVALWLREHGGGEPCLYVQEMGPKWLDRIGNGGSVHDAAKMIVAQAVKAAAEGHSGINQYLWDVRADFVGELSARGADERRRGEKQAVGEWRSMIAGAVQKWGGDVALDDEACDGLEGF